MLLGLTSVFEQFHFLHVGEIGENMKPGFQALLDS